MSQIRLWPTHSTLHFPSSVCQRREIRAIQEQFTIIRALRKPLAKGTSPGGSLNALKGASLKPWSRMQILCIEDFVYDEDPRLSSDSQWDSGPIQVKNTDLVPTLHLPDGET